MDRNQNLGILLLACMIFCYACGQTTDRKDKSKMPILKKAKTQAIILTQDFAYDTTDKNKITGSYVSHDRLEIPKNLTPQNKWFMFEGPVLENDLVAYRYYADSRHRFDIYGKTVPELVMDTVSWDYHDIMDWGSDILKVGNSLGIGSPAIQSNDSLYTLSNWGSKIIEKVDTGDDVSMIRTTFTELEIDGHTFDLIQDWSIEPGQPWSEIHLKVVNGDLPKGLKFATGIVKHLPEIKEGVTDEYFYAYNWGKQSFHEEHMGMAIKCHQNFEPTKIEDEWSHAYVFDNARDEVTYWFLAAWERDQNDVHSHEEFKVLIESSY